jgi:hypothetical protein
MHLDEEMENRESLTDLSFDDFDTPQHQTACISRVCTWKHFCAYGVPTIAITSTIGFATILGYNWMNPTVTIATQDLQLLYQLLNQTSPLIDSAKVLIPKANTLLDESIILIQQANNATPLAQKFLEQVEDLYPYADYVVHKIINITHTIEHLLGKSG